ncbi:hypothetical protein CANARDRAFT_6632 [[Candida] arabinofermentans NRRL YB-2248]|uniref:Protein GLC8 n=1 Tax=[Candida] arabinofermentans NRRL YB-2248 TaxID=983967 RepID=A0A1E4T311_9ASCO|nr:hypothetical protein CANARDRAFT_6632 [[Candida] arabinofermentans NRRL YB-2248]
MPNTTPPRSILKNSQPTATYKTENPNVVDLSEPFDRSKVIENTKLNSKLTKEQSSKGDKIREKIDILKKQQNQLSDSEIDHLKWDEKNLLITELEKNSTMKIDEPKTPYEGGFDPNNDYYRNDNEDDENNNENNIDDDDEIEPLGDISLGAGADDGNPDDDIVGKLNEGRLEVIDVPTTINDEEVNDEEEEEEDPEEKHKRFEELRKKHYHSKGNVLRQPIQISDDEDDS